MRVIKNTRLQELAARHPASLPSVAHWKTLIAGSFANLVELRKVFPHADQVMVKSQRTITIFNLGCVWEINQSSVSEKGCRAKATEAEVAQRAMPTRATPAGRPFSLTRRARRWAALLPRHTLGRSHRLITAIHYNAQRVFILRLLTHAEYDKNTWKNEL